jgi:hypothetical protein
MNVPINVIIFDSSKKKYIIKIVEKENNTLMCLGDLKRAIGLSTYSSYFKLKRYVLLPIEGHSVPYISTDLILEEIEELKRMCENKLALLAIEKYIKNIPSQKTGEIKENTKTPIINENTNSPNLKSKNIPLVDLEETYYKDEFPDLFEESSSEGDTESSSEGDTESSSEGDTESSYVVDSKIREKQHKAINEAFEYAKSENKKNEISQKYDKRTIHIKQKDVKKFNNPLFMNEDGTPIRFVYAENTLWINNQDLFKFIKISQPSKYVSKHNINSVRMDFDGADHRLMISFEDSKDFMKKMRTHCKADTKNIKIIIDTTISVDDLIDRTEEEIEKARKKGGPGPGNKRLENSKESHNIKISSKNEDQSDKIPQKKSKIENDSDSSDCEFSRNLEDLPKPEFEKRMKFFLNLWDVIPCPPKKKIYNEMKKAIIKYI